MAQAIKQMMNINASCNAGLIPTGYPNGDVCREFSTPDRAVRSCSHACLSPRTDLCSVLQRGLLVLLVRDQKLVGASGPIAFQYDGDRLGIANLCLLVAFCSACSLLRLGWFPDSCRAILHRDAAAQRHVPRRRFVGHHWCGSCAAFSADQPSLTSLPCVAGVVNLDLKVPSELRDVTWPDGTSRTPLDREHSVHCFLRCGASECLSCFVSGPGLHTGEPIDFSINALRAVAACAAAFIGTWFVFLAGHIPNCR